jgi:AcrR family transcriptional regulator
MASESTPRRSQILEAAERLFRHYGPGKTTVADIARACGIGVGSVYLDFASKEAIVDELTRARTSRVAWRMRTSARAKAVPDRLVEALRARIEELFELAAEGQHACDLVRCGRAGFDPDARAYLVELLREGLDRGELTPGRLVPPEQLVASIELAFAALSPPDVFRFERAEALAHADRLGALVVWGLVAPARRASTRRRVG